MRTLTHACLYVHIHTHIQLYPPPPRNARLYCSEVTRSLLLKDPDFSHLAPFLKGLPMEEALSMSLDAFADSKALTFTVTLLPAGHCPGSAMCVCMYVCALVRVRVCVPQK